MISFPDENTGDSLWEQFEKDPTNTEIRKKIAEENLGLVYDFAHKLLNHLNLVSVDFDDLVCMGTIGLIDAIERFEHRQGNEFSTFAVHRIRGAIFDELRGDDACKKNVRTRLNQIEHDIAMFAHSEGREPTEQELIEILGCSRSDMNALLLDACGNAQVGADGKEKNALNTAPDVRGEKPDDRIIKERINPALLKNLDQRERMTILWQFEDNLNKRAIAASFGVDPAVVSRLDKEAKRKILKTIRGEYVASSE